jgi:hypothetical protein
MALLLGPVTYLSVVVAARPAATNDRQIDRAWEVWRRRAMGA